MSHAAGMLLASTGPTPRLFNGGTLDIVYRASPGPVTGVEGAGFAVWNAASDVINLAGGTIALTSDIGDATGIGGVTNVWNAGRIAVASGANSAWGVADVGGQIDNRGAIEVIAARNATGIDGTGRLFNTGIISVRGGTASSGIDWLAGSGGVLVNGGNIAVSDSTPGRDSAGIRLDWTAAATLWNSGTIAGDFALRRAGSVASGATVLTVVNSGRLTGAIDLASPDISDRGALLFLNGGTIEGDVTLGGGDDVFDGRAGMLVGACRAVRAATSC